MHSSPASREDEFVFQLPFPAQQAVYDNVQLFLDDKPLPLTFSGSQAIARTHLAPGAKSVLHAAYRSQGLDSWRYLLSRGNSEHPTSRENADRSDKEISQARDFHLLVKKDYVAGFRVVRARVRVHATIRGRGRAEKEGMAVPRGSLHNCACESHGPKQWQHRQLLRSAISGVVFAQGRGAANGIVTTERFVAPTSVASLLFSIRSAYRFLTGLSRSA